MKKLILTVATVVGATIGAGATAPALAAVETWQFLQSNGFQGSGNGNAIQLSQGGVDLSVTAWSDTAGTTNTSNPDSEKIETAELRYYGNSLGIVNQDESSGSPNHSIDSIDDARYGDDIDAALLSFSEKRELEGFSIGWATDNGNSWADISVLYYDGAAPLNTGTHLAGKTWGNLLSPTGGWKVLDNFANVLEGSYQSITSAVTSTAFLISAYNPIFGSGSGLGGGNDGFKLASVDTKMPNGEVPAPGSLLLLALGLLLLRGKRRPSYTAAS